MNTIPPLNPSLGFDDTFVNQYQAALVSEKNLWTHELPSQLPGTTVLGQADQALVRAFTLMNSFKNEIVRLAALVEKQDSPEARDKALGNLEMAKLKLETMHNILRIETARRFPQIWREKECVGVYLCEGWKVATIPINLYAEIAALAIMLPQPPNN